MINKLNIIYFILKWAIYPKKITHHHRQICQATRLKWTYFDRLTMLQVNMEEDQELVVTWEWVILRIDCLKWNKEETKLPKEPVIWLWAENITGNNQVGSKLVICKA